MTESELKVLLDAASVAKIDPANLKPVNPFSQQGPTAQTLQIAVQQVNPALAARWRVEAGETVSLASAAAKAGLAPMTQSTHDELSGLDADYITGQQEAAARREADLLASLEKGADELAAAREKQQASFKSTAGSNSATGQHNRAFTQRWGDRSSQLKTPARRVVGR